MSLPDTIFIFALALVIFGPKRMPEIGRQIGKLMFEFRRASNEFKLQIEEELRSAEAADRRAQTAAQLSTPPAPSLAPAESPEPLTIRPPSTGSVVSAGPLAAYSSPEGELATESEPNPQEIKLVAESEPNPQEIELAAENEPNPRKSGAPPADLGEDLSDPWNRNLPADEPIPNHHG